MEIIYALLGLAVGFFIGFIIFKNKKSVTETLPNDYNDIKESLIRAESKKNQLDELLTENKEKIELLQKENTQLSATLSSAETNLANMNEKLENQKKDLEELQTKFALQFENLANKIFDEKSKAFKETNKQQLNILLDPLQENLKEFKNAVKDTYEKGLKERTEITTELKQIQRLNQQLQEEASNLTKALKGDSQKQGRWGEMILERILESSGLEKGEQYKTQDSFTLDSGRRLRPDAVVYLPEKKHIIIDSKVSLVAFEKYANADNEEEKTRYIKEHIDSVRKHIKDLASKDYINNLGLETPEYLLMFIPVEASFSAAVTHDKSIFNDAWEKKIVIVSPSTLIATLMTIASMWKQTKQTEHAIEIAERGGKLYDKFYGFIEDMDKIGQSLKKAESDYDSAYKKLITGSGSLVRQTEMLKDLGAKTTKALSKDILSDYEEENKELPSAEE